MKRETKVGLLVGILIIVLIGIVVSDHLSVVQQQDAGDLSGFAGSSQTGIGGQPSSQENGIGRSTGRQNGGAVAQANGDAARPQQRGGEPRDSSQTTLPNGDNDTIPGDQAVPMPEEMDRDHPGLDSDAPRDTVPNDERLRLAQRVERDESRGTSPDRAAAPIEDTSRRDIRQIPPNRPAPQPVVHYVKANESLWSIAQKYYGDGAQWRKIKAANPRAVGANDSVRPGVRLVIPNKAVVDALRETETDETDAETTDAGRNLRAQIDNPAVREVLERLQGRTPPQSETTTRGSSGLLASRRAGTVKAKPGDTLSQISERALGTSRRWREILELNSDQLESEHDLRAGMVLRLPRDRGETASSTAAQTTTDSDRTTQTPSANQYKIRPGDTLYSIARRTLGDGERWRDIYNNNRQRIPDADRLPVGVTLTIPQ